MRLSSAHGRGTRRSNQPLKQRLGERVAEHALGVPLYAHDPVAVPAPFHRFNHAIGRVRGDAQAASSAEEFSAASAASLDPGSILTAWCGSPAPAGRPFLSCLMSVRSSLGMSCSSVPPL